MLADMVNIFAMKVSGATNERKVTYIHPKY
jgi:hypothetical protein